MSTSGSDSNDGKSPDLPIKTLSRINSIQFSGGENVLLKKGDTWNELLQITSKSFQEKPIIFSAYGSGNDPIIDGQRSRNGISITSSLGVVIDSLNIKNGGSFGIVSKKSSNIFISNCLLQSAINDNIVFIDNCCNCFVERCIATSAQKGASDTFQVTGVEVADGCQDISITDSSLLSNIGAGISVHCHSWAKMPERIYIDNCYINGNNEGIFNFNQSSMIYTSPALTIRNNIISNNSSGIRFSKVGDVPSPSYIAINNNIFENNSGYDILGTIQAGLSISGNTITGLSSLVVVE